VTAADPRSRWRIGVGGAVVLALVALGVGVAASAFTSRGTSAIVTPTAQSTDAAAEGSGGGGSATAGGSAGDVSVSGGSGGGSATGPGVVVHILGAVAHPGLYELDSGARGVDAVAAAGGFTKKADQSALNLARFLSDGEQIVVPKLGESPPPAGGSAGGSTAAGGAAGGAASGGAGSLAGLVNLNTAEQADLETLPRIGPALAQRILAWREENGRFSSVDDLKSVTGIGDKTFAGLADLVTV
jgi:competence protein ComEA